MTLSNDFFDYAQLSAGAKLLLGYKGPQVLTELDSTSGLDATVAYIDAEIDYPSSSDNFDQPGKIGGPALDLTNALSSKAASTREIAVPVTKDDGNTSVADYTNNDVKSISEFAYSYLNSDLQGSTAEVSVRIYNPFYILDASNIGLEYDDDETAGTNFVVADLEEQWDGSVISKFNVTLPTETSGKIRLRAQFDGDVTVDSRYYFIIDITKQGEQYSFIQFREQFGVISP